MGSSWIAKFKNGRNGENGKIGKNKTRTE